MSVSIAWGDPLSGVSGSCSPSWVCSPETVDFRQIGGWEYSRLVLLGGKYDPTRRHSSCRYSSEWCQHCGHQSEALPWHASMGAIGFVTSS